jgi:NAD(P)-dependent dehydrogenase (short-subunit alcohol dehydrogenase family)
MGSMSLAFIEPPRSLDMNLTLTYTMHDMTTNHADVHPPTPVAVVTGASRGLGNALTTDLVRRGWRVIIDARDAARLAEAVGGTPKGQPITAVPGDVADTAHRLALAEAVAEAGGLDLLVNNASVLGPSPQPRLAAYPIDVLEHVYAVNTVAPLALLQLLLPFLEPRNGRVVNVSSDAAVEAYAGWGGYGSAKAALDHLSAVLAVELPHLRLYAFDPGDMATDLQQQAFPGEDITDRASPESVVPALLRLVDGDLPSGRYRAAELATVPAGGVPA